MTDFKRSGTTRASDGVCCYLAGILFPIIFLTTAPYKSDRFIRFHSFQSIAFTLIWVAVINSTRLLRDQTGVVATVMAGAWVGFFITWILLMIKAYKGRTFKLPLIGSLAYRWAE